MSSNRLPDHERWQQFADDLKLSPRQLEQFQQYFAHLVSENERTNLTAITGLKSVLHHHFLDSLKVQEFVELSKHKIMVDVGAGAGFPAIPLKIMYPHLGVILLEVTHKKQIFLKQLVELLELDDVEVCPLDWRTFLRTTEGEADLFVSRAALDVVELSRLFRHTSAYRNASLVYWASEMWEVPPKAAEYVKRVEVYTMLRKTRQLVFMSA